MKKRLTENAARRFKLLETIEFQRTELSAISEQLQPPLAIVDAGISAIHFIRQHPAWVASGLSALLFFRHRGMLGLAQVGGQLLYQYRLPIIVGLKKLVNSVRTPPEDHPHG